MCTKPMLVAFGSHRGDDSDLAAREIKLEVDWKVQDRPLAVVSDCLKEILDKWSRETVERFVTQGGVLRDARPTNLIQGEKW